MDKRLCKGTLANANGTLYTSPAVAGGYTVIKAITLCNKTAAAQKATIKFAATEVIAAHTVAANDTVTIPFIDQIITTGELIEGLCDAADAINYYISGKELS